jgi:hypothetical protein
MGFPVGFSRSREKKGKKDEQFSMTLLNIYNNFKQKEIVCNTSNAKKYCPNNRDVSTYNCTNIQ